MIQGKDLIKDLEKAITNKLKADLELFFFFLRLVGLFVGVVGISIWSTYH